MRRSPLLVTPESSAFFQLSVNTIVQKQILLNLFFFSVLIKNKNITNTLKIIIARYTEKYTYITRYDVFSRKSYWLFY